MFARLVSAVECGAAPEDVARAVLHAYVACLHFEDLVEAAVVFLNGPVEIRGALRNRLIRLAGTKATPDELEFLASRLLNLRPADRLSRSTLDTLISALYRHFPAAHRRSALDRWIDTGTRSTAARWLTAISGEDLLFDAEAILTYWRRHADWRAAKVLAYKAPPELLASIMPELVRNVDEGWIISRAAVRVGSLGAEEWEHVQAAFPASYLYLCAMLGYEIEEDEAVALVRRAGSEAGDTRGLAIWALGEMGMVRAVDRAAQLGEAFLRDERDAVRARLAAAGVVFDDENGKELGVD